MRLGYSRAVAAVYEAPPGSALPHLAVILLDGEIITAQPMDNRDRASAFAADALKILRALELAGPEITVDLDS